MLYIDETIAEVMGAEATETIFPKNPFVYPDLKDAWYHGYLEAATFALGGKDIVLQ